MNWISILGRISIWIVISPLIIGVIKYKRLNFESKLIFYIVIIGAIPQVLRFFFETSSFLPIAYNLYTPSEFFVYYLVFIKKIRSPKVIKVYKVSVIVFIVTSLVLIFNFGIVNRFLNEWVILNNTIQIVWICFCLLEYYNLDEVNITISEPFFWFMSGITIYATSTIVFYSLWYFIKMNSGAQTELLKVIHHIFNILLYILFSIGLYKNKNKAIHQF